MNIRPTIRLRLTALNGALFVLTSTVLISSAYLFVSSRIDRPRDLTAERERIRQAFDAAGFSDAELLPGPRPDSVPRSRPASPDVIAAIDELANEARRQVLNDLLVQSLLAFAVTAAISLALAWWVAGRALAPVDDITSTANTLSENNLHNRLPNDGPDDELHRLRAAFNAMLGRLERGFDARRRFAADASHELRTPLAVLRAQADNALESDPSDDERDLAIGVREQVARSERLIDALLALSRAEEGATVRIPLDLADLVGDVVGDLATIADQRCLDLQLNLVDAPIVGDPALLTMMVRNLVQNAINHNQPDGWLSVDVTCDAGIVTLRVANSGIEVDETELQVLFDRFQRGRTAEQRHGYGLGLAIVDTVARVHGAIVTATPIAEGGLDVRISLSVEQTGDLVEVNETNET